MYAEVKRDGSWHLIGGEEENRWIFCEDNPDGYPLKPIEVYDQSNYTLFAILADVRNDPRYKNSSQYFSKSLILFRLPAACLKT
jgi:hypothetical protein